MGPSSEALSLSLLMGRVHFIYGEARRFARPETHRARRNRKQLALGLRVFFLSLTRILTIDHLTRSFAVSQLPSESLKVSGHFVSETQLPRTLSRGRQLERTTLI